MKISCAREAGSNAGSMGSGASGDSGHPLGPQFLHHQNRHCNSQVVSLKTVTGKRILKHVHSRKAVLVADTMHGSQMLTRPSDKCRECRRADLKAACQGSNPDSAIYKLNRQWVNFVTSLKQKN